MDKEIVFLDFGFITIERARLRTFNFFAIDIKIGIVAGADVSRCFGFPVHAAAQVGALVGEGQDCAIGALDDVYAIAVDCRHPSINSRPVEVESSWNIIGIIS